MTAQLSRATQEAIARLAEGLDIPAELLCTRTLNHYSSFLKPDPGEPMLSPDEQAKIDQLTPNAEDWRSAAWQHRGTLPAQSAWFALTTKLKKAKETYLKIAHEAFESNNFERAAYWKSLADGIDYALNLQSEIANEVRDAVGSATQPPAAGGIPIP